jgi:hypothetical protein
VAQRADTIFPPRLPTTFAMVGGAAYPAVGTKTFPVNRKPESSPSGNCPWIRKSWSGSIRKVLFRTILNSTRGLIRATGQPVLTFNVADVAAETLAQQIFSCCWSNTLDALSNPPSTSFALLRIARHVSLPEVAGAEYGPIEFHSHAW